MAGRDDMVIRPRLDEQRAAAPTRAREERRIAGARNRRGIFARIAKARAARSLRRRRRARSGGRRVRAARSGAPGLLRGTASTVGRGAGRAAVANPVGAIVAALVVAGVVATRLVSGQSFENIGQQVNNILLGDLDEGARASAETRNRLGGDSDIARIIGQEGRVNSQIAALHKSLARMAKRDALGASLIRSEKGMQVDSTLDILIVRARDKFLEAWSGNGGNDSIEKVRRKLDRPPAGGR